jgi:hypothetical protein
VQLRESENSFFIKELEKYEKLQCLFIEMSVENIEILFLEEQNTMDQILPLVGKLLRNGNFKFTIKMLYDRLNRLSSDGNKYEIAWTIFLYSSMLTHRIAYQVI